MMELIQFISQDGNHFWGTLIMLAIFIYFITNMISMYLNYRIRMSEIKHNIIESDQADIEEDNDTE